MTSDNINNKYDVANNKNEKTGASFNSITIDFGQQFVIKGVTGIAESTDKSLIAYLGENTLSIAGDNLNLVQLDVDQKFAIVSGSVSIVKYNQGKGKLSLLKKLVK
ncbi:MAG: YabP/YqfC family sporulation protein [Christensenellales bacterium]